jgi:ribonuclease R
MNFENKILEALRRKRLGLTLQEIFGELRAPRKERGRIEGHLREMEGRGLVRRVKARYLLPPDADIIRGRFQTSGRGFGFVVPEAAGVDDVFVPARFTGGAVNGDTVEVLSKPKGLTGRPEGRVVRIVKKERKQLVGLYAEHFGQPRLVPFELAQPAELPLASRAGMFPAPGMVIAADRGTMVLTDVFGFPDDPGVDTKVVIRRYGLPDEFPPALLAEAEAAAARGDRVGREDEEDAARVDHRGWTTFTIDGEKAQDFDDAVSIRRLEGGRRLLGVHIADVSFYVRPGTALDDEAYERATSVYFSGLTLPMLPERLSNDVCSLRPREDRRAFSVEMEIDAAGEVVRAEFRPSLIRTAERLTYTAVHKVFEGDEEERLRLAPLVADLLEMRDLAALLRRRRLADGSLDFDLIEPELVYAEGRMTGVAGFAQNEAHKLIEEFMVAANVAVASRLASRGVPAVYRVHDRPAEADLDKLREMLAHFGIMLPPPAAITSADLQAAVRAAEGKKGEKFVNVQVLRALRLAVYAAENIGHYGLAKKEYAHFTSPIRRYPDLLVHRILKAHLHGAAADVRPLEIAAAHSSERERRADAAENDLLGWRIFRFLKNRLGDEFDGIVTDVNKAGLVVALTDFYVEGLVAFADLGGDYYRRKSPAVLAGRRTGRKFELGQEMKVQLAAVDPMLRRMTLVPVE